ncbi:TPA: hypothetical protein N0F65_008424 [Lagenidium giganteum]|uniref:Transmembrane protein n=1 Tax=Lagenidium giganteum TaxID=4803 RepID=A0AAV2Z303_9STRA|nr:TPA: hypothetical protein N0F65_008424 [Lagenidium giganteum]
MRASDALRWNRVHMLSRRSSVSSATAIENTWKYVLDVANPLPEVNLTKTLAAHWLPETWQQRLLTNARRHFGHYLVVFNVCGVLMVTSWFVSSSTAAILAPILNFAAIPFTVVSYLLLNRDMLAALCKHFEFWFATVLNVATWVLFALVMGDARASSAVLPCLAMQLIPWFDANFRTLVATAVSGFVWFPAEVCIILICLKTGIENARREHSDHVAVGATTASASETLVFTATFVTPFVLNYQRELLRMLLKMFDFWFITLQFGLGFACLADMLNWDRRSGIPIVWSMWVLWVLLLDALTPPVKARFGLTKRYGAVVMMGILVGILALGFVLFDDTEGRVLKNRAVLLASWGNLRIYLHTQSFLFYRVVTLVIWACRLLYDLAWCPIAQLVLIRGGLEFWFATLLNVTAWILLGVVMNDDRSIGVVLPCLATQLVPCFDANIRTLITAARSSVHRALYAELPAFASSAAASNFVLGNLCVADMLSWDRRSVVVIVWSLWVLWVLLLDALTPPVKARFGLTKRHAALIMAGVLVGLVTVAIVLFRDTPGMVLKNRAILLASIQSQSIYLHTQSFLFYRVVTLTILTMRLLYDLVLCPSDQLVIIRGSLEVHNPLEIFPIDRTIGEQPDIQPEESSKLLKLLVRQHEFWWFTLTNCLNWGVAAMLFSDVRGLGCVICFIATEHLILMDANFRTVVSAMRVSLLWIPALAVVIVVCTTRLVDINPHNFHHSGTCMRLLVHPGFCIPRDLVWSLLSDFEFLFSSWQFLGACICLCSMMAWDFRCLALAAWALWFHWILMLDALTPAVRVHFRLKRVYAAPVLVGILLGIAWIMYSLFFSHYDALEDHVLGEISWGTITVSVRTSTLLVGRLGGIVTWSLRLVYKVFALKEDELLFIRGSFEYRTPYDIIPATGPRNMHRHRIPRSANERSIDERKDGNVHKTMLVSQSSSMSTASSSKP